MDIETIPCEACLIGLLATVSAPASLAKEEEIREWEESALLSLQERQYYATALNETFGRIICIGLIPLSGGNRPKKAVVIYINEEKKLVVAFWEKIKKYNKPYLVTYNDLSFDLPFI